MRLKLFREFVENDGHLDAKMSELKDLIDSNSEGHNVIYEWKNKEDHELIINFLYDDDSIRYEFDIDNKLVIKVLNDVVEFEEEVSSIDEGLDLIEKDIYSFLGINEGFKLYGQ